MCKQKYVPAWNSMTFMFGMMVGILAGHFDAGTILDIRHILLVLTATLVFYLTQSTSPKSFFKRKSTQ